MTQPQDDQWYLASDGNWYCWPDPTPFPEPPGAASSPTVSLPDRYVGDGVKPEHVRSVEALLVEGETLHGVIKSTLLRPMADLVVATNIRIFSTDSRSFERSARSISCRPHDVQDVRLSMNNNLKATLHSGDVVKLGQVRHRGDHEPLRAQVLAAGKSPYDSQVAARLQQAFAPQAAANHLSAPTVRPEGRAAMDVLPSPLLPAASGPTFGDRELAQPGNKVAQGSFGGKNVEIYEGGFLRVLGLFGGSKVPYERLISIEDSADVSKKSGLGRTVVGVATLGTNLITSGNKRGDLYLTIVTDLRTRVLHQEPPTALGMKAVKRLAAAGRAVIEARDQARANPTVVTNPPRETHPEQAPAPSLGDRLREYERLLSEGLLSRGEYDALRAKALDAS